MRQPPQEDTFLNSPPAPVAPRFPLFLTVAVINFVYALYFGALGVTLPALGAQFHLGTGELGQLFVANFGGYIPGVALSGFLSDRFGRKPVILLGALVYFLALLGFASASSFALCLVFVPLIGAGSGAMLQVANALISDLYADKRTAVLNTTQVIFGAGAAIAPLLANLSLAAGVSWRTIYLVLAVGVALLLVVFAFQRVPPVLATVEPIRLLTLKAMLRNRHFLRLNFAQFCYAGAEVAFFQWITTYLVQMPGGSHAKLTAVSLFWVCMTAGRMMNGILIQRFNRMRLGAMLALLGGLAEMSVFFAKTPNFVLLSIAFSGLLLAGVFICIAAEVGERFSHATGTAFGALGVVSGLGISIPAWLMGVLSQSSVGWTGAMLVPPLLAGCTAFLLARMTVGNKIA